MHGMAPCLASGPPGGVFSARLTTTPSRSGFRGCGPTEVTVEGQETWKEDAMALPQNRIVRASVPTRRGIPKSIPLRVALTAILMVVVAVGMVPAAASAGAFSFTRT